MYIHFGSSVEQGLVKILVALVRHLILHFHMRRHEQLKLFDLKLSLYETFSNFLLSLIENLKRECTVFIFTFDALNPVRYDNSGKSVLLFQCPPSIQLFSWRERKF